MLLTTLWKNVWGGGDYTSHIHTHHPSHTQTKNLACYHEQTLVPEHESNSKAVITGLVERIKAFGSEASKDAFVIVNLSACSYTFDLYLKKR